MTSQLERLIEKEEARRAALANTNEPVILTADEVRAALRADMKRLGINTSTWAERHAFSVTFVSAVLTGKKEPSEKLCAALGIERRVTVTYVRKGK
ncbi:MAG: hypothetical protein CTY28_14540 [Hyphomicrobium sp.]|nr:MAG: hypothetical protein CTY28_14540 [Hyphomicrobium sp.]